MPPTGPHAGLEIVRFLCKVFPVKRHLDGDEAASL